MGEEAEGTRRTLRFIFSVACERVFPSRRLVGGNAIGNGYWYTLSPQDGQSGAPWGAPCSPADAAKILAEMQALIEADAPISSEHVPYADALAYMQIAGQHVALNLLKKRVPLGGTVAVKSCCVASTRHLRLSLFPLLPSTGALKVPFTVEAYAEGGLILVQGQQHVDQPALSSAVGELKKWTQAAGIAAAADLCDVEEHDSRQALLVHAAEARLESKLGELARAIAVRHAQHPLRVVCIAGPTASGKTTFSHKLALALRAEGIFGTPLTVDHYYLPLDRQPKYQVRQQRSDVDYDSIESMDVELVQQHILDLTQGKTVTAPRYNMKDGLPWHIVWRQRCLV